MSDKDSKPTNPKDLEGVKKIPYHLFPMSAIALGAVQMLDGGGKYGRENYRHIGVSASIYYDAAIRHLNAWFSGENLQQDNGIHHLGGAIASIAILIDAMVNDKLTDNRNYTNKYTSFAEMLNVEVQRLIEKHKDKDPKHYSKLDVVEQEQAFWYCDHSPNKQCKNPNICNSAAQCKYPRPVSAVGVSPLPDH